MMMMMMMMEEEEEGIPIMRVKGVFVCGEWGHKARGCTKSMTKISPQGRWWGGGGGGGGEGW